MLTQNLLAFLLISHSPGAMAFRNNYTSFSIDPSGESLSSCDSFPVIPDESYFKLTKSSGFHPIPPKSPGELEKLFSRSHCRIDFHGTM